MSGIITITANPAIDKTSSVTAMMPERKMKCARPVFEPGGGGVNVARAIKKLGGSATAVFFAGGYSGQFFKKLLDVEEIKSDTVEIQDHTRENLIIFDQSTSLQYRFGMPGPVIAELEWKKLLSRIQRFQNPEFIIGSGSLSPGMPIDFYARIAFIAKKKKAKCIIDTSGDPLKLAINEGVFMIKPSLAELNALVGPKESGDEMVSDLGKMAIENARCEVILVSMGLSGAMLITKKGAQKIAAPVVNIKSTVGAGDSMVAGVVISLSRGKSLYDAAQYGVACGTAATLNAGTALCKFEDAERIFKIINEKNLKDGFQIAD
jgi:6-phosphofructokinase 2